MNAFTMIRRAEKEAMKNAREKSLLFQESRDEILNDENHYKREYDALWERNMKTYIEAYRFQAEAKSRLIEMGLIEDTRATQTYFITIRPDTTKVTFDDFYKIIQKYTERACIKHFKLSFEQKSTDLENLGDGFHVHIVAHHTCKSKGEVARTLTGKYNDELPQGKQYKEGAFSKWLNNGWLSAGCVDVVVCKNPDQHFQRYCVEYKCDQHDKQCTKEADAKWRQLNNIESFYENSMPHRAYQVRDGTMNAPKGLALENPTGVTMQKTHGPIIVEIS